MEAYNWQVIEIDGHNHQQIGDAGQKQAEPPQHQIGQGLKSHLLRGANAEYAIARA